MNTSVCKRKKRVIRRRLFIVVVVFLLIIIAAATIMGAIINGILSIFYSSTKYLVMQSGNNKAILSGKEIVLGDSYEYAVFTDEDGDFIIPIEQIANSLGLEFGLGESSKYVTLSKENKSVQIPVVDTKNIYSNQVLFVSANEFANAIECKFAISQDGNYAILSNRKIKDKQMTEFCEKATISLGNPFEILKENSIIFRAGSDNVIKNGQQMELNDSNGNLYSPYVDGEKYYLPVNAISNIFNGKEKGYDSKVKFTVGENEFIINKNGKLTVNGTQINNGAIVSQLPIS